MGNLLVDVHASTVHVDVSHWTFAFEGEPVGKALSGQTWVGWSAAWWDDGADFAVPQVTGTFRTETGR